METMKSDDGFVSFVRLVTAPEVVIATAQDSCENCDCYDCNVNCEECDST